jgi:hypothetical protein
VSRTYRPLTVAFIAVAIMALSQSPLNAALPPVVSDYPLSGVVSQDGTTVTLGYEGGCVGGLGEEEGTGRHDICFGIGGGPFGVHQIALLTPGSMRIRLSAPAQFIDAGSSASLPGHAHRAGESLHGLSDSRKVVGFVKQLNPTEGALKFKRPLFSGELAWVTVRYDGMDLSGREVQENYKFYFAPIHGLSLIGASCVNRIARVTVFARTEGRLVVSISNSRPGASLARTSIRVTSPGKQVLRLRLPANVNGGNHANHCLISATLTNSSGNERATLRVSNKSG